MLSCQRSVGFNPIANVHKHSVWIIFWYWIVLLHWPTPTPLQFGHKNQESTRLSCPGDCPRSTAHWRSPRASPTPNAPLGSSRPTSFRQRQTHKTQSIFSFLWKKSPTLPPNFVHGLHKVVHSMPGAAQISCIGRGPSFAKLLQDSFKAFGLRLDNFKPFSKQPFRTNLLTKPVFDSVANFGALPREHAKKAALMPWGPGASTLASSSNKHRITCASIVSPSCVLVCP